VLALNTRTYGGVGEAKGLRLLRFIEDMITEFERVGEGQLANAYQKAAQRTHLKRTHAVAHRELRGMPAVAGQASGKARVITNSGFTRALETDEILIAPMTSPSTMDSSRKLPPLSPTKVEPSAMRRF
jgi:hypothetical protein